MEYPFTFCADFCRRTMQIMGTIVPTAIVFPARRGVKAAFVAAVKVVAVLDDLPVHIGNENFFFPL
jgi:hypothetical protein